jgi:hypothetical protein
VHKRRICSAGLPCFAAFSLIAVGTRLPPTRIGTIIIWKACLVFERRDASLVTASGYPPGQHGYHWDSWQSGAVVVERIDPYDFDFKRIARTIEQILYPDVASERNTRYW